MREAHTKSIFMVLFLWPTIGLCQFDQSLDCRKPKNGYEVSQCSARLMQENEDKLARVYAGVESSLKADEKQIFLNAKKTWKNWLAKEAELCAALSGFSKQGSGYGAALSSCTIKLTEQRIENLRDYLRNAE